MRGFLAVVYEHRYDWCMNTDKPTAETDKPVYVDGTWSPEMADLLGRSTESDQPEWVQRAVTLRDHFDGRITLRVAQPQPQYGTVQLNAEYKGDMLSVDVNAADLLAALGAVMSTPPGEASGV